jgi:hypothetical protein
LTRSRIESKRRGERAFSNGADARTAAMTHSLRPARVPGGWAKAIYMPSTNDRQLMVFIELFKPPASSRALVSAHR